MVSFQLPGLGVRRAKSPRSSRQTNHTHVRNTCANSLSYNNFDFACVISVFISFLLDSITYERAVLISVIWCALKQSVWPASFVNPGQLRSCAPRRVESNASEPCESMQ